MRFGSSFIALGSLALLSLAPETTQACHWFKWGHGRGYAPRPIYYAPPMYPGTPAPGAYYVPPSAPMYAPGVRAMPAAPTTSAPVVAKDNSFDPMTLSVQPGATVRWVNNGQHPHTVTSRDGKFDSGDIAPGGSYSMTFQTPGTYRYYCKHHKGMEGSVIVGEPGKPPMGGTSGSKGSGY